MCLARFTFQSLTRYGTTQSSTFYLFSPLPCCVNRIRRQGVMSVLAPWRRAAVTRRSHPTPTPTQGACQTVDLRRAFLFQVLTICNRIMDEMIPDERADRDFRVKFPDDVMQESLAGQLWFGAEVRTKVKSGENISIFNLGRLVRVLNKSQHTY